MEVEKEEGLSAAYCVRANGLLPIVFIPRATRGEPQKCSDLPELGAESSWTGEGGGGGFKWKHGVPNASAEGLVGTVVA